MLFHVGGEIERVLSGQPFRKFGVALLQRIDHVQMIDDRALGAMVLPDRHLPDGADMDEQVLRHVANDQIAAQPDAKGERASGVVVGFGISWPKF